MMLKKNFAPEIQILLSSKVMIWTLGSLLTIDFFLIWMHAYYVYLFY